MTHTQIDEISRRNVELQDEAQKAEDTLTAERELRSKDLSQISQLQVDLGQAVHDKTVAQRECAEAKDLNARARAQLANVKDSTTKAAKAEQALKTAKERLQELEQAAKQREGTPELKEQLAELKLEVQAAKTQYEAIWAERKVLQETLVELGRSSMEFVKELMFWGPNEADVPKEDQARYKKFRKQCREFVEELAESAKRA